MRIFLDTNVLISAYLGRGLCADLLERILTEPNCELLTGEVNLSELRVVLQRPRFNVSASHINEIENALRDHTIVPRPLRAARLPLRDTEDRWVLASAIAGHADVLVTGDKDFLDIADESPIRILNPNAQSPALNDRLSLFEKEIDRVTQRCYSSHEAPSPPRRVLPYFPATAVPIRAQALR